MTLVRIQPSPDGLEAWVSCKYDPDVVALIKSVPGHRRFDPQTKVWTITGFDIEMLAANLRNAGHQVETVVPRMKGEADFFAPANSDDFDPDAVARAVLEKIDPPVRGRVFRAMGRQLYPDLYLSR
jgi:hypothetical protein